MKTTMANAKTTTRRWYLVDAAHQTLGRLASELAKRLRGKHKAEYTPHVDTGDYMIVVNADKIVVSGKKAKNKMYYHHTGYPGGLKQEPLDSLKARQPQRIIEKAVKGMLPKGPLGRDMYRKLKVYSGAQHPHQAQQPKPIDIIEKG